MSTLETEKNGLQEEVMELQGFRNECKELELEVANFNVKHKNMTSEFEVLRGAKESLTKATSEHKAEIDEMAKMQVELLNQLKDLHASTFPKKPIVFFDWRYRQ